MKDGKSRSSVTIAARPSFARSADSGKAPIPRDESLSLESLIAPLPAPNTMPRLIKVAAAQVGAVNRTDRREDTLERIIKLVEDAAAQGVKLVVLPCVVSVHA